jgi:3-phosphoshikimate 1-carboxyvinyltransferase
VCRATSRSRTGHSMFAALAEGRSRITAPLDGADTRSTAAALTALGCAVPPLSAEVIGGGRGVARPRAAGDVIDCGNSGTTARLLMGVLAALPLDVTLTGDASLQARPMRRVTEPLARMGAAFHELGAPDRLPIRIRGRRAASHRVRQPARIRAGEECRAAGGLVAGVAVTVTEPRLSRDHTERMLRYLGADIVTSRRSGRARPHHAPAGGPVASVRVRCAGRFLVRRVRDGVRHAAR